MKAITTTTSPSRRELVAAAGAHFVGLRPSSDVAMTTWSAGVLIVSHAQQLAAFLSSGDPSLAFGSQYTGGHTADYDYVCDLRSVTISAHASGHRTTVRLRDIATLLEPILHRYVVRTAIKQAMCERRRLSDIQQEGFSRRQRAKTSAEAQRTPAEDEADEAWRQIERHCEQLATDAWVACRPDQQQALFEL